MTTLTAKAVSFSVTLKTSQPKPNAPSGQVVDRDFNAAQNILLFGKLKTVGQELPKHKRSGRGGAVMPLVELRSPRL